MSPFVTSMKDALAGRFKRKRITSGTVYGTVCNVADEADVNRFVAFGAEKMGGLNGIINNAGIIRDGLLVRKDRKTGDIKSLSTKKWQQVIDVNLTGVFLGSRAFAEWHIENGGTDGVIVSISSISRHGNQGQSNYSAAKSGIVSMTALWAGELGRYGIRTGAIAPGFTRTPILEGMPPEMLERILSLYHSDAWLNPPRYSKRCALSSMWILHRSMHRCRWWSAAAIIKRILKSYDFRGPVGPCFVFGNVYCRIDSSCFPSWSRLFIK